VDIIVIVARTADSSGPEVRRQRPLPSPLMPGPDDRSPAGVVDRLLADPPRVHAMDFSAAPAIGVWSTDRDCYDLLAQWTHPGSRSLETGSGLSTVLFAALGAVHTCVTPSREEAERILEYCAGHAIDTATLTFALDRSDAALPTLTGPVDVVLIDGNHGYPAPTLDWYYAGGLLVDGGLLVLDDTQLPAVGQVVHFLDGDPRWAPVQRSAKWAAWRRIGDGSLIQDWYEQPWFSVRRPLYERVVGRVRRQYTRLRGR
jgi:predicted O-methyltransferase YrrM